MREPHPKIVYQVGCAWDYKIQTLQDEKHPSAIRLNDLGFLRPPLTRTWGSYLFVPHDAHSQ